SFSPMGTPWRGPSVVDETSAASALFAAARALSPITVMNARSFPSSAAIRSRWACVTSTGDTSLARIIRARSIMEVQTRSLTRARLENPVLGRGLDLARERVSHLVHHRACGPDERKQARQFLIRQREAFERRQRLQRVDRQGVHE